MADDGDGDPHARVVLHRAEWRKRLQPQGRLAWLESYDLGLGASGKRDAGDARPEPRQMWAAREWARPEMAEWHARRRGAVVSQKQNE